MKLPAGMLTNCMRLTFSVLSIADQGSARTTESGSGGSLHLTSCAVHACRESQWIEDSLRLTRRSETGGEDWVGVEKSASYQLSQTETASDNLCSRQLSRNTPVSDDRKLSRVRTISADCASSQQ